MNLQNPQNIQNSQNPNAPESNSTVKNKRKRANLWDFFREDDADKSRAYCQLCAKGISRGGQESHSFTNSNLWKHLKSAHTTEYNSLAPSPVDQDDKAKPTTNPLSLQRRQQITRGIAVMLAADSQPFTMVEDKGFHGLLYLMEPRYKIPNRKTFSKTIVPELYEELRNLPQVKM